MLPPSFTFIKGSRIFISSTFCVLQIFDTPHKCHPKFIEFYDVRAAEAALRALNKSEIAGKQIKIEPSHPGIARWWYFLYALSSSYFSIAIIKLILISEGDGDPVSVSPLLWA